MTGVGIQEIMSRNVAYVNADTLLTEAIERMSRDGISCLMICDGDWPVGILTERDIVRHVASITPGVTMAETVESIMTSPVQTLPTSASLDDILKLTASSRFRHIPIVDEAGVLAGIVTQTDVIRTCAMVIEQLISEQ